MKEQSNLENTKYGYDMVVGITEEAINAQMADYLDWYDEPEVIQWYQQKGGPNSPYERMAPIEDLGVDIFEIPSGGKVPEPLLVDDCYFVAAIKAKLGWSENADESPDVINLDKGIEAVTFKMFFSEFQMVNLSFGRRGIPIWTNEQQNPDKPYEFDYVVDLNLGSAEFNMLSPEQQKQLSNLNPSSAWSVQQLYLDLTTASLLRSPKFTSGSMGTIVQNFVNSSAWNKLVGGQRLVLANTVKKINTDLINAPSMVPTSIKLGISGYFEGHGRHNNESPLTTLNYLMMVDQDVMPSQFVGFDWNWVEAKDQSNYHGCMAIKRDKFVHFLRDMLCGTGSNRGPINEICFLPHTTAYISHLMQTKFSASLTLDRSHISSLKETASGIQVLSLKYTKNHSSSHDNWNTPKVENELKYSLILIVSLENNEIRINISSQLYSRVKADIFDVGTAKGVIGGYRLNPVYVIGVDGTGRLFATLKKGSDKLLPVQKTHSSGLLASLDKSDELLSKEEARFTSFASNHMHGFTNAISEFLQNSGQLFIFPGGKTFTFKNPVFSEHQDLVAELTYHQV